MTPHEAPSTSRDGCYVIDDAKAVKRHATESFAQDLGKLWTAKIQNSAVGWAKARSAVPTTSAAVGNGKSRCPPYGDGFVGPVFKSTLRRAELEHVHGGAAHEAVRIAHGFL